MTQTSVPQQELSMSPAQVTASSIQHSAAPPYPASVVGRLRLALSHIWGYLIFLFLKVRHLNFVRDARPLATHLERDVFPSLREAKQQWFTLHLTDVNGALHLSGTSGHRELGFPGTDLVVKVLGRSGVEHVRLDTSLKYGQIVEALLILIYVSQELPSAQPADFPYSGWNRRVVAGLTVSPAGFHKFCATMRYVPAEKLYEVANSYCDLFFRNIIRNYVERRGKLNDHRALFTAAPRAVILTFFGLVLLGAAMQSSETWGIAVYLAGSLLVAAIVGAGIYMMGSIQYTEEYHDRLSKQYYNQVNILSRFPETDPHPVLKLDLEGNVVYMNPATRTLLNGLGLTDDRVHEILPENYKTLVSHCLANTPCTHEVEVETHGRVIHYILSPFPDEQSIIAAGNDVTYLKKVESELRDLNQNLEGLVKERTIQLQETQDVTILCLADLAETRDPETGEHLQRTRLYVKTLAEQLHGHPNFRDFLTDEVVEQLFKSVPLHDIGKVGVRDAILLKPGKLTAEEFELEMKKHPMYGGDALRWAEERLGYDSFLRCAREIAYYHHERWDGAGYPFGLKGEQIPIPARLMALADVYDALTTKRVYKEAYPHSMAREIILKGRGTHFDPETVDAFLAIEDRFISIAQEYHDRATDTLQPSPAAKT